MNRDIEIIRNSIEEIEVARQNADERNKPGLALRESQLRLVNVVHYIVPIANPGIVTEKRR